MRYQLEQSDTLFICSIEKIYLKKSSYIHPDNTMKRMAVSDWLLSQPPGLGIKTPRLVGRLLRAQAEQGGEVLRTAKHGVNSERLELTKTASG